MSMYTASGVAPGAVTLQAVLRGERRLGRKQMVDWFWDIPATFLVFLFFHLAGGRPDKKPDTRKASRAELCRTAPRGGILAVMPMVKDPSRVFVFEQGGEDKYCYRLAAVDRQGKIVKREIINADPYAAPPWTIGRVDDVLWLWPTYHELQAWDMATITRLTTGAQLVRGNPALKAGINEKAGREGETP